MAKKTSLEKLLRRKQQRTSLDLPEPALQPVATPVETGYQVPLAPYMTTDKRRATASLIKGLETFNHELVGVAEKINNEMMKEQAIKEGVAISAAADKYIVFEDGKPVEKEENFPGGAIAKSQNLSPEDERNVATAIDEEVTQRRGYPKQREQAYAALERQGIDVTILPRWRRLWEQEEARKFSDQARAYVDNATAALVEPDSKLTVEELLVEAMQDATGDKSLTWAGLLAMSPAMAEEFQDLKNKKEQRLLPAKSEARQAELEDKILLNARTKMKTAMGLLVSASPQDAVKAQAVLISMFEGIVSSKDTEGVHGGPRIRRQVFRELEKIIFRDTSNRTLKTQLDVREAFIAMETARDLVLGTGTSEPLLRVSAALPTPDPNEESPIMLDGVKQAGVGADQQVEAVKEVAKGNPVPESGEPDGTSVHSDPMLSYGLALHAKAENDIPERAARFARNFLLDPKAFTAADGKTQTDMEGWVKSHPDYLTRDWDNDDLSDPVTQGLERLEKSDTDLGRSYKGANEIERLDYRGAIIRAMRKSIDNVQKDKSDANAQVDAGLRRSRDEAAYQHTLWMREAAVANADHQALLRSRDPKDREHALWMRQKNIEVVGHTEYERKLGLLERAEKEQASDALDDVRVKYDAAHLAARQAGDPNPHEAAERAVDTILNQLIDNTASPNHGDPLIDLDHPRRKAFKAEFATNADVDTWMSDIAAAAARYGQGSSEFGNSPNTGESVAGASGMASFSSIGKAFMKYGEVKGPEFQRRWLALVRGRENSVFKDQALRKLFHETAPDRRAGVLETQKSIVTDNLQKDLNELHKEGEAFLREEQGIADTVTPLIFNLKEEAAFQAELFTKEGGAFKKINVQVGTLTPTDLISLLGRPEDQATRNAMVKKGVLEFSIPMHRAINQIGLALETGNFSGINGWNSKTNEVRIKRSDTGTEIILRTEDLRRFHAQSVKVFGYPRTQWLANHDTMELSESFLNSGANASTTPMFDGYDALSGFQEQDGDEGWNKLYDQLEKEGKLGINEITRKPPLRDELWKIQTRLSYKAGRLAAAFHSADTVVNQTARYNELGPFAKRYVDDESLRDPQIAQRRRIYGEALERELPAGSVREAPTESPEERKDRKWKRKSPEGKTWQVVWKMLRIGTGLVWHEEPVEQVQKALGVGEDDERQTKPVDK